MWPDNARVRLDAAYYLSEHRPQLGLDVLDDWIGSDTEGDFWFQAAYMMLVIDKRHGVARLRAFAEDLTRPVLKRINGANLLARHDDPWGAEELVRFARTPDLKWLLRVSAVAVLAEIKHPAAAVVRDELLQDPGLKRRGRRFLRRLAPPGQEPSSAGLGGART